jgi:glycosyltransferase involved in cell wall biosynthesis
VIVALDATYSVGTDLSGVGVYSRELLDGLASAHPESRFHRLYRSHKLLKSLPGPANTRRGLLTESLRWPAGEQVFHALNQRMPRQRFRRSVCTFQDLFVMTGEYSSPEFRVRFTEQAREAAARADLIVAVSQFTADQVYALLGVERSRLRVIHHGVRPMAVPELRREPVVLTVGTIQHRKNTRRLVEAFGAVPEPWRLVIAGARGGYGDDGMEAGPRVEITGYVADAELAAWYGRASVFAFPSLDEGFGMPVLEAMAAGIPVLASDRSALPEVCGDAALLVDPFDPEAIACGLRRLCSDEDLREALAARGRARAAEFTWTRAVSATWDIYEELSGAYERLGDGRPRPSL